VFVASLQSTKAKGAVFVVSLYVLTFLLFVASLQSFFFDKVLKPKEHLHSLGVPRVCSVFSVRGIFIYSNI
jgi:hypothetical protein